MLIPSLFIYQRSQQTNKQTDKRTHTHTASCLSNVTVCQLLLPFLSTILLIATFPEVSLAMNFLISPPGDNVCYDQGDGLLTYIHFLREISYSFHCSENHLNLGGHLCFPYILLSEFLILTTWPSCSFQVFPPCQTCTLRRGSQRI